MNYLAYLEQEGGCDYTIGCGLQVLGLEAETLPEAIEELRLEILNQYNSIESNLSRAVIYEINKGLEMPIQLWYKQAADSKRAETLSQEEKIERQLLAKLKEKYES